MIAVTNHPQRHAFLSGEGAAWWARNQDRVDYGDDDPVQRAVKMLPTPESILEIGCANGGRLDALRRQTGAECSGIDPAASVIGSGSQAYPGIKLCQGTADRLPYRRVFDIVIFGFCLYLLDRSDLFPAIAEADRVLQDGGHLLIYDFWPEFPCRRPYAHHAGLVSYKMDYSELFVANPAYRLIGHIVAGNGGNRTAVHTLRKNCGMAYPDECS